MQNRLCIQLSSAFYPAENIPGNETSYHSFGSVKDWKLCIISGSKGNGGEKKSDIDKFSDVFIAAWVAELDANGSHPPMGAN